MSHDDVLAVRFAPILACALSSLLVACSGHGDSKSGSSAAASKAAPPRTPMLSVLAGSPPGPSAVDGSSESAILYEPTGVAADASGNLYVADNGLSTVRRITRAGVVTTLAGSAGVLGSIDGRGASATLHLIRGTLAGVATDASGNIYVADTGNNTIRKITSGGMVTTFAGTAGSTGSADGTGVGARFNAPSGLSADGDGNLYVADSGNHTIRKITPGGNVTTLAGMAGIVGAKDGVGAKARFNTPQGIAADAAGNVYVSDTGNFTIRRITTAGIVSTLAGASGVPGSTDGSGAEARFVGPVGIAVDKSGNVFIAEKNHNIIRKITHAGAVSTLAGSNGVDGYTNALGAAARFSGPSGLTTDSAGNAYVADTGNNVIRKILPNGMVTTAAGTVGNRERVRPSSGSIDGSYDGIGAGASFSDPAGIAVDGNGNVYVADTHNATIRKITLMGAVTTLAGSPGDVGSDDGSGSSARFDSPLGVAVDGSGNVYVADTGNNAVRKVSPSGAVTTLATGLAGPVAIAVDKSGNLYVADTPAPLISGVRVDVEGSSKIVKITPEGKVSPFAEDFKSPRGLATDGAGNVYVADTGNNIIRKITPAGVVTTLAGSASHSIGNVDGSAAVATLNAPRGVTVADNGNVYVADTGNNTIRKITPAGVVSTIAGQANIPGFMSGPLPGQLTDPVGVATAGNKLYITTANAVAQITYLP